VLVAAAAHPAPEEQGQGRLTRNQLL
jgi:hypothetical protein